MLGFNHRLIHSCAFRMRVVVCGLISLGISLAAKAVDNHIGNAIGGAQRDSSNWVQFPPRKTNSNALQSPGIILPSNDWVRFPPIHPALSPTIDKSRTGEVHQAEPINKPEVDESRANVAHQSETVSPPRMDESTATAEHSHEPASQTGMDDSRAEVASQTETASLTKEISQELVPLVSTIAGFKYVGNTKLSQESLSNAVRAWVGKPLTLENLQDAAHAVQSIYQRSGWLARTELPEQDLTSGVVTIQVTEALHSNTNVQSDQSPNVIAKLLKEIVDRSNPPGTPLNLEALEHSSLILRELPGIDAKISLVSGQQDGQTTIEVHSINSEHFSASTSIDNAGARATGSERVSHNMIFNGLMGRGDQTTLTLSKTLGVSALRASYSEVLNGSGARWGVFASSARYSLIVPELSAFNIRGPSDSVGLESSVPWIKQSSQSWTAQIQSELRRFRNDIAGDIHSNYLIRLLNVHILGRWSKENSMGLATSNLGILGTLGDVDLANSPNQIGDAMTVRTSGLFQKLRLNFSLLQQFDVQQSLQLSMTTQVASKNLDSSEKIFLGGAQAVRAFPMNEAAGSEGMLASLEWQHHKTILENPITWSAFWDLGTIKVSKYSNYVDAPSPNQYRLSGLGLWVGSMIPWSQGRTELRATWSRRMGSHPAPSVTGVDQDGSSIRDRFWFSMLHQF